MVYGFVVRFCLRLQRYKKKSETQKKSALFFCVSYCPASLMSQHSFTYAFWRAVSASSALGSNNLQQNKNP